MKSVFIVSLALAAAIAAPAAQTAPKAQGPAGVSDKAGRIVSQIHQTDQMEIELGRLAQRKATSGDIKRYGLLLERDHRMADKQLLAMAGDQNIRVAALEPSAQDRAQMAKLRGLSGAAFDQAFLKAMDTGHQKAIGLLASVEDKTGDAQLDRLVSRLVPILEQHRDLSEHLQRGA